MTEEARKLTGDWLKALPAPSSLCSSDSEPLTSAAEQAMVDIAEEQQTTRVSVWWGLANCHLIFMS